MLNRVIYLIILSFIFACSKNNKSKNELSAKETLGKELFFEKKLSANGTKSCASCHAPELAFSDGYRRSGTVLGENTLHNAPSLINANKLNFLDKSNPNIIDFSTQIKRPLYNSHPVEMGFHIDSVRILAYFQKSKKYNKLIEKAFSNKKLTAQLIEESIISFVKKLESYNSPFDRNQMSESAQRGFQLFVSEQLNCISCHPPPDFTLASISKNSDSVFANIGLYNLKNQNTYPIQDQGLNHYSNNKNDNGKFKIPSLRNVLFTSPYMHDGSVATIEEVLDIYEKGGRNIENGLNKGNGIMNKNKHKLIKGFKINSLQRQDLINFLATLTDSTIFTNPIFQKPN